jgi:uncharacterized protein (UPF0248 family)
VHVFIREIKNYLLLAENWIPMHRILTFVVQASKMQKTVIWGQFTGAAAIC